jgi:hypothetical protein
VRGSHTHNFERHVRACAGGYWSSVSNSEVVGRRSIDRWPERSDQTTVATGGRTAVVKLPKLWAARVGA